MNDLEWIARHLYEWPENYNKKDSYAWHRTGDGRAPIFVTYDQWLAERARLQNKPSWDSHNWPSIFQSESGNWFGVRDGWDLKDHITKGWKGDQVSLLAEDGEFLSHGKTLGGWRETQEKRPECNSVTTEPWDGGGLPPVGTVCECGDVFDGFKSPFKTGDIVKVFGSGLVDGEEECLLVASTDGSLLCDIAHFTNFRPLRSKEDSAIKEIETMINEWLKKEGGAEHIAKSIYDYCIKNQDAAE